MGYGKAFEQTNILSKQSLLANAMAPTKLACKNNEKFTYSGKEMSPLGLGYCADAEMVGSFMEGKDGKTWIVGVKNNEKVWIRYAEKKVLEPEANLINSPEEEAEPAKAEVKANLIDSPEAEPAKAEPEKPKRKYTKKAKAESEGEEAEKPKPKKGKAKKQAETGSETEEKPAAKPEKPKRKYTKKAKQPETETAVDSEAKPKTKRGPSGYNLYIGMKINEFRQNETGLKTTEYMKKAQEAWGAMSKEEQKEISAELKAAVAAKEVA